MAFGLPVLISWLLLSKQHLKSFNLVLAVAINLAFRLLHSCYLLYQFLSFNLHFHFDVAFYGHFL